MSPALVHRFGEPFEEFSSKLLRNLPLTLAVQYRVRLQFLTAVSRGISIFSEVFRVALRIARIHLERKPPLLAQKFYELMPRAISPSTRQVSRRNTLRWNEQRIDALRILGEDPDLVRQKYTVFESAIEGLDTWITLVDSRFA